MPDSWFSLSTDLWTLSMLKKPANEGSCTSEQNNRHLCLSMLVGMPFIPLYQHGGKSFLQNDIITQDISRFSLSTC